MIVDPGERASDPTRAIPTSRKASSTVTVLIALAANLLVAVAKSIAAVITGAASMVAEAAHSWADTGNEVFLLFADRRSRRPRDAKHPIGYGRDAYVWSMFAAFGLFSVGAVVSVMHGVQELVSPEPAEHFFVSYIVLAVAFVLEGVSFLQALRQARRKAAASDDDVLSYVMDTSDPTLRAVFFEDAAALIGLVIAFFGIFLHELTGSAIPDAIGSILVGVLLGVIAIVLIGRNRRFIVGVTVDPAVQAAAISVLTAHPDVASVSYLHIEFVGPGKVFVVAAVDLAGDAVEHDVAARLASLEDDLERRPQVEWAVITLSRPGAVALGV